MRTSPTPQASGVDSVRPADDSPLLRSTHCTLRSRQASVALACVDPDSRGAPKLVSGN